MNILFLCVDKLRIRSNTTAAYWKKTLFSISYIFLPKLSIISLCIKTHIFMFLYKHWYVPLGPKHAAYWKHCTIFQQNVMFGSFLNSPAVIYYRHKKKLQPLCCTMQHAYLIILLSVLQTVHWLIRHLLWHWSLVSVISIQPSMGCIRRTATISIGVIATNELAIKNINQNVQFIVVIDRSQHENNDASCICVCNATG